MNKFTSKRLMAYLLDTFLVYLFIIMVSNIKVLNPNYDKLLKTSENYNVAVSKYEKGEISNEDYLDISEQYVYDATKYNISTNIIFIVVSFLYYCVFQKFNNGQTLGKKIMKIKVVDNENKNVSFIKYILRLLPMYFIFIGSIIPYILSSILVWFMNVSSFSLIYSLIVYLFMLLGVISFFMAFKREDKRGLHDILAGTKVIEE